MKEAKSRFNGKYNSHICDDEITANPSFFPPVNFKREQEQKATEIDGGGGVGGDSDDNSGPHCQHQLFQKHEQQPKTG